MAARKKKKASKKKSPSRAAKSKKAPARKAPARKSKAKKPAKSAKKAVKAKPAARKTARKTATKKQIVGEGDYQASRSFLKDQSDFVKRNKASIPAMGRDAGRALEGPEGDALRQAEAEAASHSRQLP